MPSCPYILEKYAHKCYFHNFKLNIEKGLRVHSKCICNYCKAFAHKKIISAHMKIVHMNNTHHPCKICSKLFTAAHMGEHLKSHVFEHPFKCEKCGMTFKTHLGYQ